MNERKRLYIPLVVVFGLVNALVFLFKDFLHQQNFNLEFILISNLLLFIIVFISVVVQLKTIQSANNLAFIRGVYTSMIIKMFVCMIAIFIYIFAMSGKVNQPGLFISMGLYILYTAIEVRGLMKTVRKTNV